KTALVAPARTPGCVADTATRIPLKERDCAGFGRTYTQEDIQRTGQPDTAQALRLLDPSLTVHGHWSSGRGVEESARSYRAASVGLAEAEERTRLIVQAHRHRCTVHVRHDALTAEQALRLARGEAHRSQVPERPVGGQQLGPGPAGARLGQ